MGLFSRSAKDLAGAIDDYRRAPNQRHAMALLALLSQQQVVIGMRELPAGVTPGQVWVPDRDTPVQVLGTTTPDGSRPAYAVFTSAEALAARNPQAYPVGVDGSYIFREVASDDSYAALVVDPGPRYAAIPRAWVVEAAPDASARS